MPEEEGVLTILRHQRIIRSAKIYKPIPFCTRLEQHRNGVESARYHCRPLVRHQVALGNHMDVLNFTEHWVTLDIGGQVYSLSWGGLKVQVQNILVPRMVHGL